MSCVNTASTRVLCHLGARPLHSPPAAWNSESRISLSGEVYAMQTSQEAESGPNRGRTDKMRRQDAAFEASCSQEGAATKACIACMPMTPQTWHYNFRQELDTGLRRRGLVAAHALDVGRLQRLERYLFPAPDVLELSHTLQVFQVRIRQDGTLRRPGAMLARYPAAMCAFPEAPVHIY